DIPFFLSFLVSCFVFGRLFLLAVVALSPGISWPHTHTKEGRRPPDLHGATERLAMRSRGGLLVFGTVVPSLMARVPKGRSSHRRPNRPGTTGPQVERPLRLLCFESNPNVYS
ncbi:unnamed protein product, partial [Hapterophycus canaliculatus]